MPATTRHRRINAATATWLYVRLSALGMLALVLIHLAIMHLGDGRESIDARFVRDRVGRPLWLVFDIALLLLALTHGMAGLRGMAGDYLKSRRATTVFAWASAAVTAAFAALGTAVLIALH
ncbi:hypothetical protein E1264_30200 [Actinomadura sp. KC216]|uniref:hypothetical protein n=1 Tax=Actinomadura sp. KC216 TaxID=2530370 RepID=UPI00104FD363|nr:hypothetical protein [Actinomadura sp. KC216]TDB83013.1 hypothetical protein E1264_30200 [Actinomadura sp. KC216]